MPDILDGGQGSSRENLNLLPKSLRGEVKVSDLGTRAAREIPNNEPRESQNDFLPNAPNTWNDLTAFVWEYLPDVPEATLRGASEALVAIMRDPQLSEKNKLNEVSTLLGTSLPNNKYIELSTLASQLSTNGISAADELPWNSDSDSESSDESDSISQSDSEEVQISDGEDEIIIGSRPAVHHTEIDASWLAQKLESTDLTPKQILPLLAGDDSSALSTLLGPENLELTRLFWWNREPIYWLTQLHRAESTPEYDRIATEITAIGHSEWLETRSQMDVDVPAIIDLSLLELPDERIRRAASVTLPDGSTRFTTRFYEQYDVPSPSHKLPSKALLKISDLPEWAQPPFKGVETLNVVQSAVADAALHSERNLLICAPTGAGKTNVALLAIARERGAGLIVFLSPLKALVQEQVQTFSKKLSNMVVSELSGDASLSREQLDEVDMIVATPEKWDVISRRASNLTLLRRVALLIVDEVHLLHDQRGAVLEAVIARQLRECPGSRILGLSATLPNYDDVATFLRAESWYFGPEYRPVPLEQTYIGLTDISPLRRLKAATEVCYEKVVKVLSHGHQIIVFVQSRKETLATALSIIERAKELGRTDVFNSTSLSLEGEEAFADILKLGVGVHHAGLTRATRLFMESAFSSGQLRVLVSTSTLAWGVNMPAHTVLIKGTQFYDPNIGNWRELAPQDVLQMLGRAGRPGYDTQGEGILMTAHSELNYYMGIANASLPIESRLGSRLLDALNAEVCSRSVTTLDEGVSWLGYTYLYVRMLRNPAKYRVQWQQGDDTLQEWRRRIVHSVFTELAKLGCVHYRLLRVKPTPLGRIAASYYISPRSVAEFTRKLNPWMTLTPTDLLHVFAEASEFVSIPVRSEERRELERLSELVPVPVRNPQSRHSKMSILLQAYICRLSLKGMALSSDLTYIAQSAARIWRAMHEIAIVHHQCGPLAIYILDWAKMVDRRQWLVNSPFRQFENVSAELVRRSEASQLPWSRYFDLDSPAEIGEALRSTALGSEAWTLLRHFPRVEIFAHTRPLAPSVLVVDIEIMSLCEWDGSNGPSQLWWLGIEDADGRLLLWEPITLSHTKRAISRTVTLLIKLDPGPYLFARLESDRWLLASTTAPVDLRSLQWPPPFTLPTPESLLIHIPDLLLSDRSALVGCPDIPGSWCLSLHASVELWISTRKSGKSLNDKGEPSGAYVATPVQFELATRGSHPILDAIHLLVCEDIHHLGGLQGAIYETALTRMRRRRPDLRVVALGMPLADPRGVGAWLGAAKSDVASFVNREDAFEIDVTAFPLVNSGSAVLVMLQEARRLVQEPSRSLVVVPDREDIENAKLELPEGTNITCRAELPSSKFDIVVIVGTQFWDGDVVDYPATEVLSILRHARKNAVVLTQSSRQRYYAKFLREPLPLESQLHLSLADAIAPEIASGSITGAEDALEWLSSTLLWRRLRVNPQYYGAADVDEFVSEIVEQAIDDLADAGCVKVEDRDSLQLSPLAGVYIASKHGIEVSTVKLWTHFVGSSVRSALETSVRASEVVKVTSLSRGDSRKYLLVSKDLPYGGDWITSKPLILTQLHMLRSVPTGVQNTTAKIISQLLHILTAGIDILASDGRLTVLVLLDLHQLLVQSLWPGDSPLLQIPHVSEEVASRLQDAGIESVHQFVEIDDDDLREELLGFKNEDPRMLEVAHFANHWPSLDVSAYVDGPLIPNEKLPVHIKVEREIDDDDDTVVVSPMNSGATENWYLLIGCLETRELYGILRTPLSQPITELDVPIAFPTVPSKLTLWCVCDAYVDADKEISIEIRSKKL